jgi:two-component system cell cycle sensor histidine kinase/response regulator CckA
VKILHIEDNAEDAELVAALLGTEWPNCEIRVTSNRVDLMQRLDSDSYDLVLSDFSLGSFTGLDALAIVKEKAPSTPFIFLSGTIGEDKAIEAVRAGAHDYVIKDRMKRLVTAIHRAMRDSMERRVREVAERQIREQADLLNKAHEAIIVTNLDDRITFWNAGAARLSGWSSAEAMGRSPEDVLGVGYHAKIDEARSELSRRGEWRGELHLHDRNGKALVVEVSMTLVRDDEGRPKARLSIGTDVTAKKALEEQFLRVQRLESIGMLASGIAHDLNNVLAPILMGAPLLRSRTTQESDLRVIETMETSAVRGAGLVRQILSFAHGSSGERTLVQVRHILQDIVNLIGETFPKTIKLVDTGSNDLSPVLGNATQLHQVLLNLCVNARDAMPQGGTLRLGAENRRLDEATALSFPDAHPGPYLRLEVADSGTGIPPELLSKIWDPFFTTKGEGKGTGLGLSTVRGIVANHGGFVCLESTPGLGTTFRIFLPAADDASPPGGSQRSVHSFIEHGNGELVLIVDDEANVRELVRVILTRHGYRTLVAGDGNEAMKHYASRSAEMALIVTDVNMPGLGGPELAREVLRHNEKMKIIFMSGAGSGPGRPESNSAASQILRKPFTSEQLIRRVQEAMNMRPAA